MSGARQKEGGLHPTSSHSSLGKLLGYNPAEKPRMGMASLHLTVHTSRLELKRGGPLQKENLVEESQNDVSWKRPPRSSSPTINL